MTNKNRNSKVFFIMFHMKQLQILWNRQFIHVLVQCYIIFIYFYNYCPKILNSSWNVDYFINFITFHRLSKFIFVVTNIYDTDVFIYSIQSSYLLLRVCIWMASWGGPKINGHVICWKHLKTQVCMVLWAIRTIATLNNHNT